MKQEQKIFYHHNNIFFFIFSKIKNLTRKTLSHYSLLLLEFRMIEKCRMCSKSIELVFILILLSLNSQKKLFDNVVKKLYTMNKNII